MDKGIKQSTRAGGRLEFYTVSEEAKNRIIKDASTLAIMAENDLGDLYKNVNASYPRRLDYDTANRYKEELRARMANIVTVVGADPDLRIIVTTTGRGRLRVQGNCQFEYAACHTEFAHQFRDTF